MEVSFLFISVYFISGQTLMICIPRYFVLKIRNIGLEKHQRESRSKVGVIKSVLGTNRFLKLR